MGRGAIVGAGRGVVVGKGAVVVTVVVGTAVVVGRAVVVVVGVGWHAKAPARAVKPGGHGLHAEAPSRNEDWRCEAEDTRLLPYVTLAVDIDMTFLTDYSTIVTYIVHGSPNTIVPVLSYTSIHPPEHLNPKTILKKSIVAIHSTLEL